MKELPGTLTSREIAAIKELEPLYDKLSHAPGKDAISKTRKDLDRAKYKYAALAIDSSVVQAIFELLEATWLFRQVHWNKESMTNSTFDRINGGINKAREVLKDYRWISPQDDRNRIERLLSYCTNEAVLAATVRS